LQDILESMYINDGSSAFRAALGRVVTLAAEEMTRHSDVVHVVQKPCSKILVRIGRGEPDNRLGQVRIRVTSGRCCDH
jgi:hypothetical protein